MTLMKTSLKSSRDSASFQTISQLSKVAQLLNRREFVLELKRGGCAQVQTEMGEFIVLPFPSSKQEKLKMWSFHVAVVQGGKEIYKKGLMHAQSCFLHTKAIAF